MIRQLPARIERGADRLGDAQDDAARERAPEAAETADDRGLEGEQQPGRPARGVCLFGAQANGNADRFRGFAEQCMEEYDLDGWRVPDLLNPGELSRHIRPKD